MQQLISTPKPVIARNGHVNKRGESLISIEIRQGNKRKLISTHQYIKKEYWVHGHAFIPNDKECEIKLNTFLHSFCQRISNIYFEKYYHGQELTLSQLVEVINNNESDQALLEDFGRIIVNDSDRKDVTKYGYETLFNDLRKFRANITISDVDYDFIKSYDKYMNECGLKENTIIGRMHQLRAIMNEAVKRNVIPINPFNRYKVGTMKNKSGFLSTNEVEAIEKLKLKGLEKVAQKAFLIGCYTGLRFSDIKSLKNNEISKGWIHKTMKKTEKSVDIPYMELFDGKFQNILNEYEGNIERLTNKIGENGQLNQALKKVFEKAGINPNGKSFHLSRHTFASLLVNGATNNKKTVDIGIVSKLLGHTNIKTTQVYCEYDKNYLIKNLK